ncbi:mesothelin [Carlito syrichta]|uniref:Mesothelin n=1 Tax=Carlito syrichta TaxID=1868482 RepID=A0A1U7SPX9_CARSF|nr:mesothelin [Carlito syrichta]
MALPTAQLPWGACGTPIHGSLLLLLLSLGWVQPSRAQAREPAPEAVPPDQVLANTSDTASPSGSTLLGFACAELSSLSVQHVQELAVAMGQKNVMLRADQLRCLAGLLSRHHTLADLDTLPQDLLLFLNLAVFSGPQACAWVFSCAAKVLPRGAPERQQLMSVALACRGVWGSRVSEADVWALGGLTCDLPGHFVSELAGAVLPQVACCVDQDQQEALRAALQGGGPPFGPPSTWSVSTLDALRGLLPVLDQDTICQVPEDVVTMWLQHTYWDPSWWQPGLIIIPPRLRRDTRKKACPPGRKPHVVDVELVFYPPWELEACVDGALLASQMESVNAMPFTYEQLAILKHRLDLVYPQGYTEPLVQRLGYFFLNMKPEDIDKWNVTSLDTVKPLLEVSKGRKMDAQVAALISRYLMGSRQLDKDTLDTLAAFRPIYLCSFRPENLGAVPPSIIWSVRPQDLDTCSLSQLNILYPKARLAFQNLSGSEYFLKIRTFLGGATTEDLRDLSQQNVNMDLATFKKLRTEAVVQLTVAEVRDLLGPHVAGLKAEEGKSPVRDWIFRQPQDDLDTLGLGLQGGVPSGYLVLDLTFREALSGVHRLLGPGPMLATLPALLLALASS